MTKKKEFDCLHFLLAHIVAFGLYGGGLWTAVAYGLWLPGGAPAENPPLIAVIGGWVSLIGFFSIFLITPAFNDFSPTTQEEEEK